MQPQTSEGIKAAYHTSSPELRRSLRARKLTDKGQELHKDQVERDENCFIKSYKKWKTVIKEMLNEECSNNLLLTIDCYLSTVSTSASTASYKTTSETRSSCKNVCRINQFEISASSLPITEPTTFYGDATQI